MEFRRTIGPRPLPNRMSTLPLDYLAPDIAVSPHLEPAQMADVAAQGFKSVINNRLPEELGALQDALRDAASKAGLEYEWQPVNPAAISAQDVSRFAQLLDKLPRPILAFCRSGSRSTILFQAAARQREGSR
jgi:uncharacterized protein (TIGR01244 family)